MSSLGAYVEPVSTAALIFPIIASAMALPFALIHYRRYGRIHPWRAFLSYSFVYYMMAAFFLVILPLPTMPGAEDLGAWQESFARMRIPRLDPLGFARDLLHTRPGRARTVALLQAVLNIALFMPFGAYLVYLFRKRLRAALLSGFLLSLAFEFCQFTGNFWIYPGPYRLFDAGDLLLNTTGAFLGACTALILGRLGILPLLETLAGPQKPWIGPGRRFIALLIDLAVISAAVGLARLVDRLLGAPLEDNFIFAAAGLVVCGLVLAPALDKGRGLGKRVTLCAIQDRTGKRPRFGKILLRQAILWVPPSLGSALGLRFIGKPDSALPALAAALLLGTWIVGALIQAWGMSFGLEHEGWLDSWLGTRVRNTWKPPRQGPAEPPRRNRRKPAKRAMGLKQDKKR